MVTVDLQQVNISSAEFKANPYPFYAQLRTTTPVYRTILPDKTPAWLITRYDDVSQVLKDEQHFMKNWRVAKTEAQKKAMPWTPPMFRPLIGHLLDVDGIEHTRLRKLIHKAFTPRTIEQMRNRVEMLANELLDKAEQKGNFDLVADYALPIPMTIISEILGIPENNRDQFHRWTKRMIALSAVGNGVWLGIPAIWSMLHLLRKLIAERRIHPQDDLLSALNQAEEAGDRLNEDEVLRMVLVLLIAGHETTVNLIGSGALALLEHPDQMELLHRQPELIDSAIEELVRYVAPVEQATERYAAEDIAMHGVTIPRGDLVLAVLASANRDENHFENPDTLDITRQNNKHLGFGQGVHYCVGAPLARLEGQIAIQTLLNRLPDLRLAVASDVLPWRAGLTVRGLDSLPVAAR